MVHVALALFLVKTLKLLAVGNGTQCADGHDLSLTSGEQTGTVNSRQHADFSSQRTDLVHLSAVNALVVVEQPAAYYELLELVYSLVDHSDLLWVNFIELCVDIVNDGLQALLADILVVGVQRVSDTLDSEIRDSVEHIMVNFLGLERELLLADLRLNVLDERNEGLNDLIVTCHDSVKHNIVGNLVRACLDHYHLLLGRSNGQVQVGLASLLKVRHEYDLAVNQAYGDTADRTVPRNIRDRNSDGSADHAEDLRGAVRVNCEYGHCDRNVVAHVLREQRTHRTVNNSGGQDSLLGGSALSLEEAAGDLAYCIQLLLVVNGKREEVHAVAGLCACSYVYHYYGLAVSYPAGTISQAADLTSLNGQLSAGKHRLENSVIFEHCIYSFQ